MAVRRHGVPFPVSEDATEPPNGPIHYPTAKLQRSTEGIGRLQPTEQPRVAGPDTSFQLESSRWRREMRRISGAGAAAPSPGGWRREERARGGATAVAIGPYTPQTARAVHRPKNNSNGATAKPRGCPPGDEAVLGPPEHGEEAGTSADGQRMGKVVDLASAARLDSATEMCQVLSARVLCRKG